MLVELYTDDKILVKMDNYDEKFNDGKWHPVVLTINKNKLVLSVDYRPAVTSRLININTGLYYYIGGVRNDMNINVLSSNGVYGHKGFVGCMRLITINGNYKIPMDWKHDEVIYWIFFFKFGNIGVGALSGSNSLTCKTS